MPDRGWGGGDGGGGRVVMGGYAVFARCRCGLTAPLATALVSVVHGHTTGCDGFILIQTARDENNARQTQAWLYNAARFQ